jgi:hypothetical protein
MDNKIETRINNAMRALVAYDDFVLETEEDLAYGVADLLADLMHLCDDRMIDFNRELARGQDNYRAEKDAIEMFEKREQEHKGGSNDQSNN